MGVCEIDTRSLKDMTLNQAFDGYLDGYGPG